MPLSCLCSLHKNFETLGKGRSKVMRNFVTYLPPRKNNLAEIYFRKGYSPLLLRKKFPMFRQFSIS